MLGSRPSVFQNDLTVPSSTPIPVLLDIPKNYQQNDHKNNTYFLSLVDRSFKSLATVTAYKISCPSSSISVLFIRIIYEYLQQCDFHQGSILLSNNTSACFCNKESSWLMTVVFPAPIRTFHRGVNNPFILSPFLSISFYYTIFSSFNRSRIPVKEIHQFLTPSLSSHRTYNI